MLRKLFDYIKELWYKYVYNPDDVKFQGLDLRENSLKKYVCNNCLGVNTFNSPICTCTNCGQVTIFETKLMEHLAISLPNVCLDGVTASIDTWALSSEIQDMDNDDLYDEVTGLQLHAVFPPEFYRLLKQYKETNIWNQEERRTMEGAYILFYTNLVFGEEQ